MSGFVHLRVHTEFSLANGLVRIGPLMRAAAESGMPAVALTDLNNLFAVVKFYRRAMSQGIKPIIGLDARVRGIREGEAPSPIVLLCQNDQGYKHLTRLVTRLHLEGTGGAAPVIERDWLAEVSDGLIALSGGPDGEIGAALLADNPARVQQSLDYWQQHFPGRFYLELQRCGREADNRYVEQAVALAAARELPVVATNDVRFLRQDDFEAHEVKLCIQQGRTLNDPRRPRECTPQQYLRGPEEMAGLFSDIPEALENAVEIARRCSVELSLGENVLPEFPLPAGETTEAFFRRQSAEGLERRLAAQPEGEAADNPARAAPYHERLARELDVITGMGYPGYFLIVADFIRWARENHIPVGPGRGSGAGSLVAYALGITNLDPLRYDLLFERFLNPERVSMPDFDVDFCMEGRDRVIDYVAERYGRDKVSQIITYGSMAAKAVVRDVGRVLGHPYGYVDRIAKLIPFELGITLDKALERGSDLRQAYDEEEDVQGILDTARALEGLARNAGKHAGGVVISPSALTDFTPLYCEPGGGSVVTQLDKDDVEAMGLVKFDFLGLRTLTIIDRAVANINRERAPDAAIDADAIPLDDAKAYGLLQRQETTAVFQLESHGIRELIKYLKPDKFDDVVALVALYRPGPLQSGMVEDFISRKHGARVEYSHPELEPVLKETYGVILYQEQVMQIAQVLAGYSLGEADLLRRAMGKKKPEEMAKQRAIFVDGAVARGVEEPTATYIFDLMEKFAGYGFNKSHSVAYALLSYQTAWLKAHYPAAFMAAVLSADMDNTDKVVNLIDECRRMGLDVVPPDVNRSMYNFTVPGENTVLYGLGAIRGVGRGAVEVLVGAREQGGSFADLNDLCVRVGGQRINRRFLETVIRAGALDCLGQTRATLMAALPDALKRSEQQQRDTHRGQNDLFGNEGWAQPRALPRLPEWDDEQRLTAERDTLGLYLTGHPINQLIGELERFITRRIGKLQAENQDPASPRQTGNGQGHGGGKTVVLAGLIMNIRTRNTQSGRIAFVTLDDNTGRIDVGVFAEEYRTYGHLLVKDRILIAEGSPGVDEYTDGLKLRAQRLMDIESARVSYGRGLRIVLAPRPPVNGLVGHLHEALVPYREGDCGVQIGYIAPTATAELALADDWNVVPNDTLLQRLRGIAGIEQAEIIYP